MNPPPLDVTKIYKTFHLFIISIINSDNSSNSRSYSRDLFIQTYINIYT